MHLKYPSYIMYSREIAGEPPSWTSTERDAPD
ncbi:hypothetical protein RB213_007153 [Colletotrichum asianum]